MNHSKPCPVIWAIGNKGYLVQSPLVTALGVNTPVLAVTSSNNINLQEFTDQNQLLLAIPTPDNWLTGLQFLINIRSVRKQLVQKLKLQASIVHVVMCSPWDIFFLGVLSKVGVPVIVTIHDAVQHKGEESALTDYIRDWCISKADLVTVLSNHVANILRLDPKFKKPMQVVADGLVMHRKSALAARSYPSHRPIKILFHGRIHAYKGLDILLNAMLLLQSKGKNYSLTIAGSGELGGHKDKIKMLNHISVKNHFLSDDELSHLLVEHDVSVLPYIEASQSAVALDALWAALPAVATPVGALPQQFNDGFDALLTTKIDAASIADALARVCDDKILYEHLSMGAHQSYKKTGPMQAANQWLALYNKTIIRHQPTNHV